jgi:drug/metabolite transporter (DMT)-like permease
VQLIGANRAGLYVNLVPVFTALIAIVFLSERLFVFHIISLLLVLSGIFITEKFKHQ